MNFLTYLVRLQLEVVQKSSSFQCLVYYLIRTKLKTGSTPSTDQKLRTFIVESY